MFKLTCRKTRTCFSSKCCLKYVVKIWKENIENCSSYGAFCFEKTCFEKNAFKVSSWVWKTPDTPQEKREIKQKFFFSCMKPFASCSRRFKLNFTPKNRFSDKFTLILPLKLSNIFPLFSQNALRNLVENSMGFYQTMLETPALCALTVNDDFVWGNDLVNTQFRPSTNPVFLIELMMNEGGAYYSKNPEIFEVRRRKTLTNHYRLCFEWWRNYFVILNQQKIISIFDNALTQCHQIHQAHPLLLPRLKFPRDLFLSSVGLLEKSVCDVRNRLVNAYKRSVIPVVAYAKEYEKHLALCTMDVVEYIA